MNNISVMRMTAWVAVSLSLSACQAMNPYLWSGDAAKKTDEALRQAARDSTPAPLPQEVRDSLLPPLSVPRPDGTRTTVDPRFDIAVSGAPARQVFGQIVEGTRYSMIVHPDVKGAISLNLKGVTVEDALRAIREVYGYEYRRDGDRFFIFGTGIQTRIFQVDYLNLTRKGTSDTRVIPGELHVGGSEGESSARGVHLATESNADFWKELRDTLTSMIGGSTEEGAASAAGDRFVAVNAASGQLVVRAYPRELRAVEEYLAALQNAVARQVVLEAKIINVELNDKFQAGINWAALQGSSIFGFTGGGTIFNGGVLNGVSEIGGNPGNLNGILPNGTDTSAFGGVFSVATQTTDFASFVELLKAQGDVHVLSSPRVSTINNQKAIIKVGGDAFFVTGVTSTPSGVVGVPPTTEIEVTPYFSGIVLDVTPQIDQAGMVTLHIHPSVSAVEEKSKSLIVSDAVSNIPFATSSIQESDNVVRARSGQVIVIGGLMKESTTDENAGIPFLSDLPAVGSLFKHKKVVKLKQELVILLKPTVIEAGSSWSAMIEPPDRSGRKVKE
jgi:MSHA biogenesis protein MshL